MSLGYQLFRDENGAALTLILSSGAVETVTSTHQNFEEIKDLITAHENDNTFHLIDEEYIKALVNPGVTAGATLRSLSERVAFDGRNILFDNDPLDSAIAEHIIRIIQEGGNERGYSALVNFLEKISTNPSENSRDGLYDFIIRHNITIAPDGDVYLYKGVKADGRSIWSGFGIVNGVAMDGHLPNEVGSILEIPRSQVIADNAVGCGTGLHGGTHAYASGYAQGRLVMIKVNPRDVVSVPRDCSYQKIRTARYEVVTVTDVEYTGTTWNYEELTFEKLTEAVNSGEVLDIQFDYTHNADIVNAQIHVTGTHETNDHQIISGNKSDSPNSRHYIFSKMSNITLVGDNDEQEEEQSWDDYDDRDWHGEVESTEMTANDLLESLAYHGLVIDFNYVTVEGEPRSLENFVASGVRDLPSGVTLITGLCVDGEERSYRLDRMTEIHEAS